MSGENEKKTKGRLFIRLGREHAKKQHAIATMLRVYDTDDGCSACVRDEDGYCAECTAMRDALRDVVERGLLRLAGHTTVRTPVFASDRATVLGFVGGGACAASAARVAGGPVEFSYRCGMACWVARGTVDIQTEPKPCAQ
jgi:choline dehydrogenase-like flavoprotein